MRKLRDWQLHFLVGIGFAVVVLLMTWPAIQFLGQQLIGNNEDTWIFFWNNWWFREAVTNGLNLFETPYIFHPTGASLVAHSSSFTSSFLAFLLGYLVEPVSAYNLVLLFGLWLSAMGMYFLVRDITGSLPASLLAGFIFAFAPYHVSQLLAHAHLGSIHWWPFYIMFLRRTLLSGRWRDALLAGLFASLTIWTGLQLGILLALWTVLYLLYFFWQQRSEMLANRQFFMRRLGLSGAVLLTVLILAAPLIWAVATSWSTIVDNASIYDESFIKQTDLLSYFVPPILNPLWGDRFPELFEKFAFNGPFRPYPGFAVIALVLVGLLSWGKEARFWLISGAFWLLFAAGSALRFNGLVYQDLPLPYQLLNTLFPISAIRAPDRFNLLFALSFSVLSGIAIARMVRHTLWRWAALVLGLIVVVEYLIFPVPKMDHLPDSSFLNELATEEPTFAVMHYPMGYTNSKYWLYYQTLHGKPSIEGHVSRYSSDIYEFIAEQPLLKVLYDKADQPRYLDDNFFDGQPLTPQEISRSISDLKESGIRYLLVSHELASDSEIAQLEEVLPLFPVYQDEALSVFDFDKPQPVQFSPRLQPLSPDVELIQAAAELDSSGSNIELDIVTRKITPNQEIPDCLLQLDGTSSSMSFSPLPGNDGWQLGELAQQMLQLTIPKSLADGRYNLEFICPDAPAVTDLPALFIRDRQPLLLRQPLDLQFNDSIELDGYNWWLGNIGLHLELVWRANSDVKEDYKVFIHLLDESGSIVWQHDALHCNWQCPSSQWKANQQFVEETIIPVWMLPPGSYKVALGLYEPGSGARLQLQDSQGNLFPDNILFLKETFGTSRSQ